MKKANMVVQLAKLKASVVIQQVARLAPRQDAILFSSLDTCEGCHVCDAFT